MAYRKKTLRSMSPVARKLARLIGELDSVSRRAKNLIEEIQLLEADSRALAHARDTIYQYGKKDTTELFEIGVQDAKGNGK